MLEGGGPVLDAARDVSRVLRDAGIRGPVVGGVAVSLHGHRRTTTDVDCLIDGDLGEAGRALRDAGLAYSSRRREFDRDGVPIHLVTIDDAGAAPRRLATIDEIVTVSLPDLIDMKLHAGLSSLLRAQDIADVIGLIRARRLGSDFAARLRPGVRREFRTLVRAVQRDRR